LSSCSDNELVNQEISINFEYSKSLKMKPSNTRLLSFFILCCTSLFSQIKNDSTKVGLVLSGGGAKGISYIGALRALEANEIPIDYIVGTSIGGVVGGLYAAGYSPDEMEAIIANPNTLSFIRGETQQGLNLFYNHHIKPSMLLSLQLIKTKKSKLSVSPKVINSSMMQLAFNTFFYKANALSQSDFDQLFVPFRTVYSNIEKGSYEYMKYGLLANHVRASMNVPLVYPKHHIGGKTTFDGGIYNNFPIRVMKKEFNPDNIIGVQTGGHLIDESKTIELDSENLRSLFTRVLVNNSEYKSMNPNTDVLIHPEIEHRSAFDFKNFRGLIQIGEESVRSKLPELQKKIKRRVSKKAIDKRRSVFDNKFKGEDFDSLAINTFPTSKKTTYVRKILQPDKKGFNYADFEKGYNRLASSPFFDNLNPQFIYNQEKQSHYINLEYNPENKFRINVGGAIASQGLGHIYSGFEWQTVNKTLREIYGDFYFNDFKKYIETGIKHYFPTKTPFFASLYYKGSWYDYLKSSKINFDYQNLVFFNLEENTPGLQIGVRFLKEGLLTVYWELYHGKYIHSLNLFEFNEGDLILKHWLSGPKFGLRLEKSTLNTPQYATRGTHFEMHLYRIMSKHNLVSNTSSNLNSGFHVLNISQDNVYTWNYAKLDFEKYIPFKQYKWFTLGIELEAVYSSKKNFTTTLQVKETGEIFDSDLFSLDFLTSPQFLPFWNSERFLSTFHTASSYVAVGINPIFHLTEKLQLRWPFYAYNYFFENSDLEVDSQKLKLNPNLFSEFFINNGLHLVYKTPLFPISVGVNRYDALVNHKEEYNFFFKIGFSLGNKMQLK
jgi:NTE family protein